MLNNNSFLALFVFLMTIPKKTVVEMLFTRLFVTLTTKGRSYSISA